MALIDGRALTEKGGRDPGSGQPLDAAVIEEIVPPGVGAPLHRHSREDEISYVIEGTFRIWREQEIFDVGPGSIALFPRHQVHMFQNVGVDPGRLLTVILPGGFRTLLRGHRRSRSGAG